MFVCVLEVRCNPNSLYGIYPRMLCGVEARRVHAEPRKTDTASDCD